MAKIINGRLLPTFLPTLAREPSRYGGNQGANEPHGETRNYEEPVHKGQLVKTLKSKELCYSCKEPNNRCRGKGKVYYVEVHYDSDDDEDDRFAAWDSPSVEVSSEVSTHMGQVEEFDMERTIPQFDHLVVHEEYVHKEATLDASLEQSHEANDTHTFDGQSDDRGLDVLAPSQDEIRMLGDLPFGLEMTSKKSCAGDDEPPMELRVTHSSPSQSPMLATIHEDISGIPDVVEEPCVVIEHKGHSYLQAHEERHDLETYDYIHTFHYGESESPLLGSPSIDQVVEIDMSMGYLLPRPTYSDRDAFLVCQDGHITCMDISVWDPGVDNISRGA
jgi:hypothetical protein